MMTSRIRVSEVGLRGRQAGRPAEPKHVAKSSEKVEKLKPKAMPPSHHTAKAPTEKLHKLEKGSGDARHTARSPANCGTTCADTHWQTALPSPENGFSTDLPMDWNEVREYLCRKSQNVVGLGYFCKSLEAPTLAASNCKVCQARQ